VHTESAADPERLALANRLIGVMDPSFAPDSMSDVRSSSPETQESDARDADRRVRVKSQTRMFAAKYLPPEVSRPIVASAFADAFVASELRAMIAFYESPVGRKLVGQNAEILLVIRRAFDNILQQRRRELGEATVPSRELE